MMNWRIGRRMAWTGVLVLALICGGLAAAYMWRQAQSPQVAQSAPQVEQKTSSAPPKAEVAMSNNPQPTPAPPSPQAKEEPKDADLDSALVDQTKQNTQDLNRISKGVVDLRKDVDGLSGRLTAQEEKSKASSAPPQVAAAPQASPAQRTPQGAAQRQASGPPVQLASRPPPPAPAVTQPAPQQWEGGQLPNVGNPLAGHTLTALGRPQKTACEPPRQLVRTERCHPLQDGSGRLECDFDCR